MAKVEGREYLDEVIGFLWRQRIDQRDLAVLALGNSLDIFRTTLRTKHRAPSPYRNGQTNRQRNFAAAAKILFHDFFVSFVSPCCPLK